MIKISVIVPVYNIEPYIRECLDSIVNQTYSNLEIILVDDGSTDSSGLICDEYAQKNKRITVFHKPNGGLVSARKTGVLLATGEYVTYVDSDDWIETKAYEELAKIIEHYYPDILAFGFKKEYTNFAVERQEALECGFYSRETFWETAKKCVIENDFFCPIVHASVGCKIFKTELARKYQMAVDDDICSGEDIAVVFPLMINMENVFIEKRCFYHYRVNKKSICWSERNKGYQQYLKLAKLLTDFRCDFFKNEVIWKTYFVQMLYFYLILGDIRHCIKEGVGIVLYPDVKEHDNVLVYGKGVFASSLINALNQTHFCNIVDWIDREDASRIQKIPEESYKYIIIAITDYSSVIISLNVLKKLGVDADKILYIQGKNLCVENLPYEIRMLLE